MTKKDDRVGGHKNRREEKRRSAKAKDLNKQMFELDKIEFEMNENVFTQVSSHQLLVLKWMFVVHLIQFPDHYQDLPKHQLD